MADEDYYDVWIDMLARVSPPRFRALIPDRAGVALDADLAQYLVTIEPRGPIGVLELAELMERTTPRSAARSPGRKSTAWSNAPRRRMIGGSRPRRSPPRDAGSSR
jgi:hypothetical protein